MNDIENRNTFSFFREHGFEVANLVYDKANKEIVLHFEISIKDFMFLATTVELYKTYIGHDYHLQVNTTFS